MTDGMVSIEVPESTFRKLKRAAELTYRPVNEILVSTLEATLTAPSDLPADLADELGALHLLSDEALWAAVQSSFSRSEETRLQQINTIGSERDLTAAEKSEQKDLLNTYYRAILRRAQAFAILAQRGHVVDRQSLPSPYNS